MEAGVKNVSDRTIARRHSIAFLYPRCLRRRDIPKDECTAQRAKQETREARSPKRSDVRRSETGPLSKWMAAVDLLCVEFRLASPLGRVE